MKNVFRRVIVALVFGFAFLPAGAGAVDPFEGTWVLNLDKSSFKPGPPGFKSQTRVITLVPEGIFMTVDLVSRSDAKISGSGTYRPDGRDYPFTGIPGLDSLAMTKSGERVQTGLTKLGGRPTMRVRFAVSDDNRTLTIWTASVEGATQPFDNTLVFDRK